MRESSWSRAPLGVASMRPGAGAPVALPLFFCTMCGLEATNCERVPHGRPLSIERVQLESHLIRSTVFCRIRFNFNFITHWRNNNALVHRNYPGRLPVG